MFFFLNINEEIMNHLKQKIPNIKIIKILTIFVPKKFVFENIYFFWLIRVRSSLFNQ